MIIQAISSIVPGYRANGLQFGELVPTDNILKHIGNVDEQALDIFDTAFISNRIGIHSIALTNETIKCMEAFWDHRSNWTQATAFSYSQRKFNTTLYDMLEAALADCIEQVKQKTGLASQLKISHHIHMAGIMHPFMEHALFRVREKFNIRPTHAYNTILVQQGCTSFLTALRLCEPLLKTNTAADQYILITAENNMISNTHTLLPGRAKRKDLNEWIYSAIFGEAVAACLVCNESSTTGMQGGWEVTSTLEHVLQDDWRLKYIYSVDKECSYMHVRAREVQETYYNGITKALVEAIDVSGGLDKLFRVCLHESNPRLLVKVSDATGVPPDMIPSTCAEIGTLAGVSSFLLLDIVNRDFSALYPGRRQGDNNKVVMASIGEGYSKMLSGYICLTAV
jgi:3-oxoacyl-[acyl-carrier-protein] synthase III